MDELIIKNIINQGEKISTEFKEALQIIQKFIQVKNLHLRKEIFLKLQFL